MNAHPQNAPARPRLGGIEALRGVAASAVVLYHAARHVDRAYGARWLAHAFQPGHAGVDLFFVLSGFIILHVHARDVGKPARLTHYAARRFSRVMPLYWVGLGATIAAGVAGGHGVPAFGRVVSSAILLPSHIEPLLGVAWTLQFEIVFYAAFAVLILNRAAGLCLLAAWLVWILAFSLAGVAASGALPPSLYSAYNLEFFFGMAAALLVRQGGGAHSIWLIGAGGLLLAGAGMAEFSAVLDGYAAPARWIYGLPAALLIAGLAGREHSGALPIPTALRRLGEASYAIYLFQFLFIGLTWQCALATGLAPRLPKTGLFALLAGAGIAGGWAVHRLVERPLLQWVRRPAA